jgi:hypothetical protein
MSPFSYRPGLLAISLAWAISACHTPSAPPPAAALRRIIPAQQVLADLTLFQHLKEAAHAGIYKYRSKAQMDSAFAAARTQVTDQMTVLDVYRLVVKLTDFEGSLHNDTMLPDSVQRAMRKEASFFPYPLKLVAGQLVLNSTHAPLPLGATISSLNGIPTQRVVRELGKYYTTDGFNTTGKAVGLTEYFPEYYRIEYGPQTSFVVAYRSPGAPAISQQTVRAVPYAVYQRAFAARHSQPSDRSFFDDMPHKYTLRLLPQQATAVLTLNTFDIGEDHSRGHRQYAQFLDSCFALLRRSPAITNLLVDARGNGGGDDAHVLLLGRCPFSRKQGRDHELLSRALSPVSDHRAGYGRTGRARSGYCPGSTNGLYHWVRW